MYHQLYHQLYQQLYQQLYHQCIGGFIGGFISGYTSSCIRGREHITRASRAVTVPGTTWPVPGRTRYQVPLPYPCSPDHRGHGTTPIAPFTRRLGARWATPCPRSSGARGNGGNPMPPFLCNWGDRVNPLHPFYLVPAGFFVRVLWPGSLIILS